MIDSILKTKPGLKNWWKTWKSKFLKHIHFWHLQCWNYYNWLFINADCSNMFSKSLFIYAKSLGYIFVSVYVYWKHTLGTHPMISCSLKQPVCFCEVLPALGHYSAIHSSIWEQGDIVYSCTTLRSHSFVKGRYVCTVNKRGESESGAESCQEILFGCQGAAMLDFMKEYGQEQSFAWNHNNTCLCKCLPATQACMQLNTMQTVADQLYCSLYKASM